MMQRTPQEEAEENAILEQAKAIESARKAEEMAHRAAAPTGAESPTAGFVCSSQSTAKICFMPLWESQHDYFLTQMVHTE